MAGPERKIRITGGESAGLGAALKRFVLTVAVVAVLLLVTLVLGVRSEFGRALIAGRLSDLTGLPVELGSSRVGLPFVLVLRDVAADAPVLQAREVRLGRYPGGPWRVTVQDAGAVITRAADGTWSPRFLGGVGELCDGCVDHVSGLTAGWRARVALSVRNATLRWEEHDGSPRLYAEGVTFRVEPVDLPGGSTYFHSLSAYRVSSPSGLVSRGEVRAWLALAGRDYVELSRSTGAGPTATNAFWEVEPR